MAEILIKARDATHPDPEVDRRGCYKRGDPVVVREDGHVWGAKEGLPNFRVLKIPGVPAAQIEGLIAEQTEDDDGTPLADEHGAITFRRRAWRLDFARLPTAARNALMSAGKASAAPGLIRAALRRKRDNTQFNKL